MDAAQIRSHVLLITSGAALSTHLSSNAVAIQVEMAMPNRSRFKSVRLRLRGASDLEEFLPDRQPIFGRAPSDGHPIEPTRLSSRNGQAWGRVDFTVPLLAVYVKDNAISR
jgi:hypothetical protein